MQRNGEDLFTRAGAFNFDSAGSLVTPDGDIVQGYAPDAAGAIDATGAPDGHHHPRHRQRERPRTR